MRRRKPNAAERRLLRALLRIAKITSDRQQRPPGREVHNIAHAALVENFRNRVSP